MSELCIMYDMHNLRKDSMAEAKEGGEVAMASNSHNIIIQV